LGPALTKTVTQREGLRAFPYFLSRVKMIYKYDSITSANVSKYLAAVEGKLVRFSMEMVKDAKGRILMTADGKGYINLTIETK
jgi:hypothetical protein